VRPVLHLSVRVPWHEAGWDGTVCQHPSDNASCLVLRRIHEQRDDIREQEVSGRHIADLDEGAYRPPCLSERATFMSPRSIVRHAVHPYTSWSAAHRAFSPTRVEVPPYAAEAVPFRWMLRESAELLCAEHGVDYRVELEARADELIGSSNTAWVQQAANHKAIFDYFYRDIVADESLVFFYAKRTPLTDEGGRVLVGAATITGLRKAQEYDYQGATPLHAMYWETAVQHSLRPGGNDGVLMPYQQLLAAADDDSSMPIERAVAFAPDDNPIAFAYATEHVPSDMALESLLEIDRSLREMQGILGVGYGQQRAWIDTQVNHMWALRGPCPGLGSALYAFGIERGTLVARAMADHITEDSDPWPSISKMFDDPTPFGSVVAREISQSFRAKWAQLQRPRRELLMLLSRFALTGEAARLF
jgi:hypothetical protein